MGHDIVGETWAAKEWLMKKWPLGVCPGQPQGIIGVSSTPPSKPMIVNLIGTDT